MRRASPRRAGQAPGLGRAGSAGPQGDGLPAPGGSIRRGGAWPPVEGNVSPHPFRGFRLREGL